MKSIKQQYIDLMEGRMSQHNFMRSLRMTMPQYITNVTSFKDSVRILKNKGILNEAMGGDPIEATLKSYLAKGNSYAEAIELTAAEQGMDEEVLMSQYPQDAFDTEGYEDEDDEFIDMISKAEEEEAGKYTKFQDFEGGLGESMTDPDSEEFVLAVEDYLDSIEWGLTPEQEKEALIYLEDNAYDLQGDFANNYSVDGGANAAAKYIVKVVKGLNERSYKVSPNAIPVSSLKKGDVLGGSGLEVISISAGAKTPSGKIEVTVKDPKTGNEVTKVWNKATKVTVKKDLNEGKKKRKSKAELHPNQIHPQELRMGIKVELEHTDDLDKAKKIALDHLAENPFYYTALKLAGVESPSVPKYKAPVAFKKEVAAAVELVDKINAMKPVKGVEKAKASSNKAKKETNKMVKGVSELTHNAQTVRGLQKFAPTGGKMKTIKEVRLSTLPNEEINDTIKHAMQYIDSEIANPTLKAISDKITLQPLRDNRALLRYEYWEILPENAISALEKQFNVEADTDVDDETLPREYYIISSKKDEKPEKYRAFQSKLEALVREVLDEMYDGRDDMDAQYAQDETK